MVAFVRARNRCLRDALQRAPNGPLWLGSGDPVLQSSGGERFQTHRFGEGSLTGVVGHKRPHAEFQRGGDVQDVERPRAESDRVLTAQLRGAV